MSQWTQINGSITLREMSDLGMTITKDQIEKCLGRTCRYNDMENDCEVCEKCSTPCGSEGSIQYKITKANDTYVTWIISIYGALRDFGSIHDVGLWFEGVLSNMRPKGNPFQTMFIREATLYAKVESGPECCFCLGDDELRRFVPADQEKA